MTETLALGDLLNRWSSRDSRYSMRRGINADQALSRDEIDAITAYRRAEIKDLVLDADQRLANLTLDRWIAPLILHR